MITLVLQKRIFTKILLSYFLYLLFSALPAAGQDREKTGVDYASMHREILKFEAVLDEVINTTFSSSTFALVQKTKGAYLQEYGVMFDFLINIHRAVINTPFGQVRARPEVTPELKRQRIEELKEKLIHVLQDNGNTFTQLPKEDRITIVAFFEDRNFPDEPSENKTIVLSVLKKDLAELSRQDNRFAEFKQRMRIIEY